MESVKSANMGLSFAVEVVMWFGFAYWGFQFHSSATKWLLGVGIPLITIVLWSIWAAPKAKNRLKQPKLMIFKLVLFGLAGLALLLAGQAVWAIIFLIAAVINQSLEYTFDTSKNA